MENKKQFISLTVLALLGLAFIFSILFLPVANVITRSMSTAEIVPEASGAFNLITFSQSMLIFSDLCYNASGPAWLSIWSIALNWIVIIGIVLLLGFVIFELCTLNKDGILIKQNAITKKLALIVGYLSLVVVIFEIVSFVTTTALAAGYFVYTPSVSLYLSAALSIGIIVCAHLLNKRKKENQIINRSRDSIGFSLTLFSVILFVVFIFIPQTLDGLSLFNMSMTANSFGQYPVAAFEIVGISQWVTFLMIIPVLALLINCLKGLNSISKKNTEKAVKKVRRWCVVWAVWTFVYMLLMVAATILLYGAFSYENIWFISPFSIIIVIFAFTPCLINSMIASSTPFEE